MGVNQAIQDSRLAFAASNPAEVQNNISRYFKSHDMNILDREKGLNTSLKRGHVGSTAFNLLQYGGDVVINPKELVSFYLIHINLEGQCDITTGSTTYQIDQSQAAVCTPNRPHQFRWRPDSKVLAIQIPKTRLISHVRDLTCSSVDDDIDFDISIDLASPHSKALIDLIHFILADTKSEHGLCKHETTARPLENAFISALLKFQPGSHQEAVSLNNNTVVPVHVRRAENHMLQNLSRPIRMGELATIAGVTERTLTNGFTKFKGAPPARYFLCLRLAEAHKRLLGSMGDTTVADIAFDLGFQHLSSFASAYRDRYGELPSETLKTAPPLLST